MIEETLKSIDDTLKKLLAAQTSAPTRHVPAAPVVEEDIDPAGDDDPAGEAEPVKEPVLSDVQDLIRQKASTEAGKTKVVAMLEKKFKVKRASDIKDAKLYAKVIEELNKL